MYQVPGKLVECCIQKKAMSECIVSSTATELLQQQCWYDLHLLAMEYQVKNSVENLFDACKMLCNDIQCPTIDEPKWRDTSSDI